MAFSFVAKVYWGNWNNRDSCFLGDQAIEIIIAMTANLALCNGNSRLKTYQTVFALFWFKNQLNLI
jgi:hypothetical protein